MKQLSMIETDYEGAKKGKPSKAALAAKASGAVQSAETAEIATVWKADFLSPITLRQYPNLSTVISDKADGQGVAFYDTMLGTDPDLQALFSDLFDDVLHYPMIVRAASQKPEHIKHRQFVKFALASIPHLQNVLRHWLSAYAKGFAVTEKIYGVCDRGEWAGSVIWTELLDKPARWFAFSPERQLLLKSYKNPYPGEPMPPEKFIVVTWGTNSDPWGAPMLASVYLAWFLRHHNFKNQAIFFEKWAQPTPLAKFKKGSTGDATKANKEAALEAAMSFQVDQAVAIEENVALSLLESVRNGSISYESYMGQLFETMSRAITGQILTMSGSDGGSHALGKVHERRLTNKVQTLARFLSSWLSREIRELVDRNFGPQEVYPKAEFLAVHPIEKEAMATVEQLMQGTGHKISRAWSDELFQNVPPEGPDDELTPAANEGQAIAIAPSLAAEMAIAVNLAKHRDLHAAARVKADQTLARLETIGTTAAKSGRAGIRKVVKSLASEMRSRKKPLRKAGLFRALKSVSGIPELGQTFDTMLQKPENVLPATLAAGDSGQPPDISDAAKLALALQALAIVDRIDSAAADATEGMTPGQIADSLTDPNGAAVDEALGNLFDATHGTNIASIQAARLRKNLSSAKFRAAYPYVMIVAQPGARLPHRVLDGFILSAEDAQYSPFLPPFGFGCRCQTVAISAAEAQAAGLTGALPAGTLADHLAAQGLRPGRFGGEYIASDGQRIVPGPSTSFSPAFPGAEMQAQLGALRAKAEELRAEDPAAWASLHSWLLWLFAYDVLTKDPPEADQNAA